MSARDELLKVWDAGEAAGGEHDLDRLAFWMTELRREPQGELLEIRERRRRTGVIFGVPLETSIAMAVELRQQLEQRFPHVVIAVAPGAASIAFEWDEPDE